MIPPKLFEKSKGTENEVHPAITYPIQIPVQGGTLSSVLFHSLGARCIQTGILWTRWNMPLLKPKKGPSLPSESTELIPRHEKPQPGSFPSPNLWKGSQHQEPAQDWLSHSLAAAQQPEHASKGSSPAQSVAKAIQRNWWIAALWGKGDWRHSLPLTHLLPWLSLFFGMERQ